LAKKEYKLLSYGPGVFFSDYSLGNLVGPALDGLSARWDVESSTLYQQFLWKMDPARKQSWLRRAVAKSAENNFGPHMPSSVDAIKQKV
jgi:hypothetical protein